MASAPFFGLLFRFRFGLGRELAACVVDGIVRACNANYETGANLKEKLHFA